MVSILRSLGGAIETGCRVRSLDDLPPARARLPRPHAGADPARRRRPTTLLVPASAAALRLRPRRLQDRPRARRPGAVDQRALSPHGVRSRRRRLRRDRRGRGPGLARPASGAAVRAGGADQPVRRHQGARRQAHAVGLLPRPQRLDAGRERPHRGADRALRSRLPRPHPRAPRPACRPSSSDAIPISSVATSTAARRRCGRCWRGRRRAGIRTRRRSTVSTSARRRRRPAAACTGCAAISPRVPRSSRCADVRGRRARFAAAGSIAATRRTQHGG